MNSITDTLVAFYREAAAAKHAAAPKESPQLASWEIGEQMYLEGMGHLCNIKQQKTTIPDLPQSKVYRYERSNLLYLDMCLTNGEYSGGQTVLYYDEQPVWLMQYNGWCKDDDPKVLDFHQAALRKNFENGEWCGGRGAALFQDERWPGLVYRNERHRTEFEYFFGYEDIEEIGIGGAPDQTVLWRRYQGILLVDTD